MHRPPAQSLTGQVTTSSQAESSEWRGREGWRPVPAVGDRVIPAARNSGYLTRQSRFECDAEAASIPIRSPGAPQANSPVQAEDLAAIVAARRPATASHSRATVIMARDCARFCRITAASASAAPRTCPLPLSGITQRPGNGEEAPGRPGASSPWSAQRSFGRTTARTVYIPDGFWRRCFRMNGLFVSGLVPSVAAGDAVGDADPVAAVPVEVACCWARL